MNINYSSQYGVGDSEHWHRCTCIATRTAIRRTGSGTSPIGREDRGTGNGDARRRSFQSSDRDDGRGTARPPAEETYLLVPAPLPGYRAGRRFKELGPVTVIDRELPFNVPSLDTE